MISRQWRGLCKPEHAQAYADHPGRPFRLSERSRLERSILRRRTTKESSS